MKRALISVYDKDGIVDFAKGLTKLGIEIISTGGTSKVLKDAGIPIVEIDEVTNFPEILGGRVKTLNPNIHGGILYRRDLDSDVETVSEMGIGPIDLIVNNLYPFEETIKKLGVSQEEIIENIDIGGPSMIRAGGKNFKYVTTIIDPSDYGLVLSQIEENGDTDLETRSYLARKVFNYTSYYDTLISNYFNQVEDVKFPETLTLAYKGGEVLRYGENPHQEGAFYREVTGTRGSLAAYEQIHGKDLSFNNINDANGALEALKEFEEPTVVAVKHANPCGIGSDSDIFKAYLKAYDSDPISIFGGIIAANREIDFRLAEKISEIFIEVVMAPSYTDEAIEILSRKKNIRLLKIEDILKNDYLEKDIKKVLGGILVQDRDDKLFGLDLELVTEKKLSKDLEEDLEFAWKAAKAVKSNGVVIVKNKATIGIGLGEVNRVWAVKNAIERAGEEVKGAVLASDGFFPFKDSIEALGEAGIAAVIQPGGSIKDEEVIEEANNRNMAMIFTGMRHFKH